MDKYDITDNDFNPTIFFACKSRVLKEGKYHSHDFAEIAFILSGKGKYLVEGVVYEVTAGDIVLCNPGERHQNIEVNPEEPTVEFVTGFTEFQFKNMPPNTIILKDGTHVLRTQGDTRQEISKLCYQMVAEQQGAELGRYFMLKAQLMQVLLLILRQMEPQHERQKACNFESYSRQYVVKKIVSYLNENYACKISLDQIAHNMYLSPVYISKIFKEETGESPINYVIKIRLERAKEILEESANGSIKEIANRVGYEDVYHFSKLFKKYYGVSPLNYKKNLA
ncbi:AraC family transcriptional regulator [Anaeromicropila populeti]|uniref:AraC-type DNA-binding protein n=1 Tax=Anaeromicropila populeti TaxID=37658 RepID=A0A1I6JCA6_9FIRM|nr:AraC family transcriptional regulator [Anaeromicropila populeti]SFR76637.1 AraC-type DNA-binding protein [Anaeromicropila populeti]